MPNTVVKWRPQSTPGMRRSRTRGQRSVHSNSMLSPAPSILAVPHPSPPNQTDSSPAQRKKRGPSRAHNAPQLLLKLCMPHLQGGRILDTATGHKRTPEQQAWELVPDKMEGVFRLAVAAWCARAQRTKAPISESSSEKAPKNKTSLRETDPETPPQETGMSVKESDRANWACYVWRTMHHYYCTFPEVGSQGRSRASWSCSRVPSRCWTPR